MIELGITPPARAVPETRTGRRPELRSDATHLLIQALTAGAGAGAVQTWAAGAVECAAGLYARGLSTAAVTPAGVPVGPRLLAEIGRDLARHGEAVYLLEVAPRGCLRLLRANTADVWGESGDPSDWWYRLTLTGPRMTRTVTAPAAQVVHLRYATERHAPQRGIAPLHYASLTGTLTASLEQSLGYEAAGAVANLIALPEGFSGKRGDDDDDGGNGGAIGDGGLTEAIRTAKGRTLLPETTSGGYGDRQGAPGRDWKPERLGADPPMAMVTLRTAVENTVLSCFGIPSPLGPAGITDGTAAREAARRLWTLTIQPLGAMIAEELTRVLERPVALEYGRPSGLADLAARARAVGALAKAGVSTDDAMVLTGWADES